MDINKLIKVFKREKHKIKVKDCHQLLQMKDKNGINIKNRGLANSRNDKEFNIDCCIEIEECIEELTGTSIIEMDLKDALAIMNFCFLYRDIGYDTEDIDRILNEDLKNKKYKYEIDTEQLYESIGLVSFEKDEEVALSSCGRSINGDAVTFMLCQHNIENDKKYKNILDKNREELLAGIYGYINFYSTKKIYYMGLNKENEKLYIVFKKDKDNIIDRLDLDNLDFNFFTRNVRVGLKARKVN